VLYINPFQLLNITSENFSDVNELLIKRAKRKLISEIELSETGSIVIIKQVFILNCNLEDFQETF
jgi:hypothetical protein